MILPNGSLDSRLLMAMLLVASAAALAGCTGPESDYRSFEFVDGADPGNELPPEMEVNASRDYLVINMRPSGQDLNARVNFTGRYYRLTRSGGEEVEFSMEELYRGGGPGFEPSSDAGAFEERLRSRGDVERLEVLEEKRSHEMFLREGESELIIEVHPRLLAGSYRGRLWRGSMTDIPFDKFNFTITPKRAAGLRR